MAKKLIEIHEKLKNPTQGIHKMIQELNNNKKPFEERNKQNF